MADKKTIDSGAALGALESIETMKNAGLRRARPPRWYGIGIALIVGVGFSLYAQQDPGNIPGLVIVLGIAIFTAYSRNRISVSAKELPTSAIGWWSLAGVCLFLVAIFFGGIFVRRAYDLAWVPVATGFAAAITIFLLANSGNRSDASKGNGDPRQ